MAPLYLKLFFTNSLLGFGSARSVSVSKIMSNLTGISSRKGFFQIWGSVVVKYFIHEDGFGI